jgi:hypothetical protein
MKATAPRRAVGARAWDVRAQAGLDGAQEQAQGAAQDREVAASPFAPRPVESSRATLPPIAPRGVGYTVPRQDRGHH